MNDKIVIHKTVVPSYSLRYLWYRSNFYFFLQKKYRILHEINIWQLVNVGDVVTVLLLKHKYAD